MFGSNIIIIIKIDETCLLGAYITDFTPVTKIGFQAQVKAKPLNTDFQGCQVQFI